jgi:hypothetical protein
MPERLNNINSATWGGAILTGVGAYSLNDILTMFGFVMAIVGSALNIYFSVKAHRLRKQEHLWMQRKMQAEED